MRKRNIVITINLFLLLGFVSLSSAAIINDSTGDAIGPTDITAIRAEQLMRGDGVTVLKVSYTSTPNLGGIMVFEADVDSGTGTGGNVSMTGIPVFPCPCKVTAGMDVAIIMLNRDQSENSATAICAGCVDSAAASCGTARHVGEWYAVASYGKTDTNGVLRGYSNNPPNITQTSKCHTFPWSTILFYARSAITDPAEQYDYVNALDPDTTRWQLSVWTDSAYAPGNEDDFADGSTFFNISDWAPNGDGILVPSVDVGGAYTYCEGNFDNDMDQDGADASRFKQNFGRSPISFKCPSCGPNY
jgi:hypothetical protein